MTLQDTARALFFVLIALILGAWDWIAYEWENTSAGQQIKAAAISLTIGTLIAIHLFKVPIILSLF